MTDIKDYNKHWIVFNLYQQNSGLRGFMKLFHGLF